MSLTSFLANKDVKERFLQEFPKPKFDLEKEILAPPLINHWGLVGTAFDYLMRFYLKRLNPKATEKEWVAEIAAKIFNIASKYTCDGDKKLLEKIQNILSNAKTIYLQYLKSGEMNDEVIKSAILLAQLDPIYRAGVIDKNIGAIDEGDVKDLKNLISVVDPNVFKAKELCVLNPTFGEASMLVGGADVDLLIDNTLIEIKTTKYLKLERDYFNQIIGYYILYRIGGIYAAPPEHKIEKLGIYYSRYGVLYTIAINDIINETKLLSFIDWFKKKAAIEFKDIKSSELIAQKTTKILRQGLLSRSFSPMKKEERINLYKQALTELIQKGGDGSFVIFEEPATKKFVQFAGSKEENPLCDIPPKNLQQTKKSDFES